MSQLAPIFNALRLPATDIDALIQGRTIAAMPQSFLRPGQQFGLYADNPNLDSGNVLVKTWARCELCQPIDSSEALDIISRLTVWSAEVLQSILAQRGSLWLAYLRVYLLSSPVEVPVKTSGQFIPLTNPITATDDIPVISDRAFAKRRERLEKLELPEEPELESLEIAISQLAIANPIAKLLDEQIQVFLGWQTAKPFQIDDPDLAWIANKDIVTLGDRSKEQDEGKSNYQAGTDFENIVRQGLDFLGYTVDQAYRGGAGGLDVFCSTPYPLTIECKAGKKIPSGTTEELIKLGGMRLGRENFLESSKLIIGPGDPTSDVITAAKEWKVSIIKPMSLQRLVELKAKYLGSVNLFELKKYLESGQSDQKVDEYVQKVESEIRLRSHIVQLVKKANKTVGIDYLCGVYDVSTPTQKLTDRELHEILIELSSPLAGYLGREKSNSNWRGDRFYFLRDLPI
jgi:hypothetical protein